MKFSDLLQTDIRRWNKLSNAVCKLGFYSVLFYRISHFLSLYNFKILSSIVQFLSHMITGAEISNRASIGSGLIILHPTAVHIGPNVKIGSNACICECCAILNNIEVGPGEPNIGDYLWMSSGSKIYGPVRLGDHVWIGPNSVVLKDIPSNMTAYGIPARILPKTFRKNQSIRRS